MTAPDQPDFADLLAYVDGQLTGPKALAVERLLERDAAAAARVAAWQRQNARIRAAYPKRSAMLAPKALGAARRRCFRRAQMVAAVLLLLLAGAAGGWAGRGALSSGTRSAEAIVRETLDAYQLHTAMAQPEELDSLLGNRLSVWLDHAIAVPNLSTFSLRLTEAERLRTGTGAHAVVLTYADAAGDPYLLYLIQALPPETPAIVPLTVAESRRAVYWPYEEYRCLLQARAELPQLRAIALAVEAQLQEADKAAERKAEVGQG